MHSLQPPGFPTARTSSSTWRSSAGTGVNPRARRQTCTSLQTSTPNETAAAHSATPRTVWMNRASRFLGRRTVALAARDGHGGLDHGGDALAHLAEARVARLAAHEADVDLLQDDRGLPQRERLVPAHVLERAAGAARVALRDLGARREARLRGD